jgi:hypothetical protein
MNKLRVLVADGQEVTEIPHNLKIFRLNSFDWRAGYDLTSISLAQTFGASPARTAANRAKDES